MTRRTLLKSALAALGAVLLPWRAKGREEPMRNGRVFPGQINLCPVCGKPEPYYAIANCCFIRPDGTSERIPDHCEHREFPSLDFCYTYRGLPWVHHEGLS